LEAFSVEALRLALLRLLNQQYLLVRHRWGLLLLALPPLVGLLLPEVLPLVELRLLSLLLRQEPLQWEALLLLLVELLRRLAELLRAAERLLGA
jgi:hypothetical protein